MLNLDWLAVLPELLLCFGGIALLLASAFCSQKDHRAIGFFSFFILLSAIFLLPENFPHHSRILFSVFSIDTFTNFFRFLFLICGLIVTFLIFEYKQIEKYKSEFYAFILFAVSGMMLMAGAVDFIMLYIAIEFVSITSYLLAGLLKSEVKSNEAALKYFLLGTIASASMLYGISLFYGLTGSTNIYEIRKILNFQTHLIVPLLMIIIGFGFKIAMVPMHMWCPDVYEGAPTPVTAFLSVGPKAAGFAVLIRILATAFKVLRPDWMIILALLSAFTMTLGNLTALSQKNIKRLLAYSSISQAGYILMAMAAFSSKNFALSGMLLYLFMNLGAFVCVLIFENQTGSTNIDDYAGMAQRSPFFAFSLTIFFLSLAGIPPLGGFVGKLFIFAATIDVGLVWLAVVGVVNIVISIYYYFNVVRLMYLRPLTDKAPFFYPSFLKFALIITLFLTIIMGVLPQPFIALASLR